MSDASAKHLSAKERPKPPPPPLDPTKKAAIEQQFRDSVLPAFQQWSRTINDSAVKLGILTYEEVVGVDGRDPVSLTPAPEVATMTLWMALNAWGLVTEDLGKWLATVGVVTVIGGGYALPTFQLYRAGKAIQAKRAAASTNGKAVEPERAAA